MKNSVKVNTAISTGKMLNFHDSYGNERLGLWESNAFTATYNTVAEFIADFQPKKLSENLMKKINDVFNNGGEVTFNYVGSKGGNRTFYFTK